MIKNRDSETAKVLKSIPSWILRWGILIMAIIVSVVIISSIELVHFQYKFTTNAHIESEYLTFSKNNEIDIEEIEYILIGGSKPIKINDLNIITNKKNIIIKISPDYLDMLENKSIVKVDIYQKQSLLEIIIGDIN